MKPKYCSDHVVNLLKDMGVDYIAFNPGSTFRGIHESLVNYGNNSKPKIITCCHEYIAVSIAQGYYKATGKPMAVAVHSVGGLLNGSFAIYTAQMDQSAMLIIGGQAHEAVEEREYGDGPYVALTLGNAVRDYVKWDDQPVSIDSLTESFYRGYQMTMSEPKGPVYITVSEGLQNQLMDEGYPMPDAWRYPVSKPPQADAESLQEIAGLLINAKCPLIIADYLGRNPDAVKSLVALAELIGIPVIDAGSRFNYPNTHPLDLTYSKNELLSSADVILGFDMHNFHGVLCRTEQDSGRVNGHLYTKDAKIIHIGLQELHLKSWIPHTGRLQPMHLSICADTSLALPALTEICKQEIERHDPIDRQKRKTELTEIHKNSRKKFREQARQTSTDKPISLAFLASEIWEVVKNHDWVLVNRDLRGWARRLWDWEEPHQWLGGLDGGTVGYGVAHSIGGALAHCGSNRLCIDLQHDGDFLYSPSALWTAAHHKIPLLIVMFNNRSYRATFDIQKELSEKRGRSTSSAVIATDLSKPAVDFSGIARSYGIYAEGPIEEPDGIRPAIERAVRHVIERKECALVDIITKAR